MSTETSKKIIPLWSAWWGIVSQLRPAFARFSTFLWFAVALAATCTRSDLRGVSSFVRTLGLRERCYGRLLDMFHSTAEAVERAHAHGVLHAAVAHRLDGILERQLGLAVFFLPRPPDVWKQVLGIAVLGPEHAQALDHLRADGSFAVLAALTLPTPARRGSKPILQLDQLTSFELHLRHRGAAIFKDHPLHVWYGIYSQTDPKVGAAMYVQFAHRSHKI